MPPTAPTQRHPDPLEHVSGIIGVGWDFPLTANKELVFRPLLNASLGNVSSDLQVGKVVVEQVTDRQINFLDGGGLNAYGLGGSVMLDKSAQS